MLAVDIAIVWLVGVDGDFPLGDDWAYAWPVRSLCEDGGVELLPWTGASVIAQVGYGALLCKFFGFSFEVLRASTLVLGALADVGVFLLARRLSLPAGLSLLAALSFALSPLRVNLGFTFMTDLPFTALAVWAACLYAKGLATSRLRPLLWGSLLAALATLIRQHGIFVAGAAALAALSLPNRFAPAKKAAPGERLRAAFLSTAAPAVFLLAYYGWLYLGGAAPEAMARKANEALHIDPLTVANLGFRAIATTAVAIAPLAIGAIATGVRAMPRTLAAATALLGSVAAFLAVREGATMPYLPNLIYDFGVGALTLRDTLFLGMPAPGAMGALFLWPLTGLAVLGGAAVAVLVVAGIPRMREAPRQLALFAALLLAAGSLLHTAYYFDRYLLPMLPFVAIVCAAGLQRLQHGRAAGFWLASSVALVATGWFSIAGTHDYMAWNRARYSVLSTLMTDGISPEQIDGGMEFNAWHLAKKVGRSPTDADVRIGQSSDSKSWWWVVDDEYVVAMTPLAGYDIVSTAMYRRWLPLGGGNVHVLERASGEGVPSRNDAPQSR